MAASEMISNTVPLPAAAPILLGIGLLIIALTGVAAAGRVAAPGAALAPVQAAAQPVAARGTSCDYGAGLLAQSLAAHGVDIRSTRWEEQRQRALRACTEGFSNFQWLQAGP